MGHWSLLPVLYSVCRSSSLWTTITVYFQQSALFLSSGGASLVVNLHRTSGLLCSDAHVHSVQEFAWVASLEWCLNFGSPCGHLSDLQRIFTVRCRWWDLRSGHAFLLYDLISETFANLLADCEDLLPIRLAIEVVLLRKKLIALNVRRCLAGRAMFLSFILSTAPWWKLFQDRGPFHMVCRALIVLVFIRSLANC